MSRRLSYHRAHERAGFRMSSVEVDVSCPECDELITCRVDGNDVTVLVECVNNCRRLSHFDRDALEGAAVALALGERESYADHLRCYDDE